VWTAGDTFLPHSDADLETQKTWFDVRFWGPVHSAKYVYKKGLLNPGASITMTGSTISRRPPPGRGMGAGVPGAIDAVTRGLAVELAPVRVNTVAPGAVETELWNILPTPGTRAAMKVTVSAKSLVKHVAQPEELAEAYLFFMKCTNVTGQILDVEGGVLLVSV